MLVGNSTVFASCTPRPPPPPAPPPHLPTPAPLKIPASLFQAASGNHLEDGSDDDDGDDDGGSPGVESREVYFAKANAASERLPQVRRGRKAGLPPGQMA